MDNSGTAVTPLQRAPNGPSPLQRVTTTRQVTGGATHNSPTSGSSTSPTTSEAAASNANSDNSNSSAGSWTYRLYEVVVEGTTPNAFSKQELDRIRKAFMAKVGMKADEDAGIFRVNDTTILALEPQRQWKRAYEFRMTADSSDVNLNKIHGPMGQRNIKIDEVQQVVREVPSSASSTALQTAQDVVSNTQSTLVERENALTALRPSPNILQTRLAVARGVESTIGIQDLTMMDCWSTLSEKSLIHNLEDRLVTAHKKANLTNKDITDVVVRGNRIFGPPEALPYGVERRVGSKLKLAVAEGGVASIEKGATTERIFLKPITVAEFMVEFYSRAVDSSGAETIAELNKIFKGVVVNVLTDGKVEWASIHAVVGRTADEIFVPAPGQVPDTVSLADFTKIHQGAPLRHRKLPCIDIGAPAYPRYLPAETCKIVAKQPLSRDSVQLPMRSVQARAQPSDIRPQQLRSATDPHPFEKTNDRKHFRDFVFCLAEVVVLPSGATSRDAESHHHLSTDAWTEFRKEIGRRYNGKLEEPVSEGVKVVLPFRPGEDNATVWRDHLQVAMACGKGSARNVLIASIPGGDYNTEIHTTLRQLCDIELGVQCNIIKAEHIIKAHEAADGPSSKTLVPFTGSVVREIFARVCIPPEVRGTAYSTSTDFLTHYGAKMEPEALGLQVAIHVYRLEGIFDPSERQFTSYCHPVTICSFTNNQDDEAQDFATSHYLVSTRHKPLAEKVAKCVGNHLVQFDRATEVKGNVKINERKAVFYRSGHGAEDPTVYEC